MKSWFQQFLKGLGKGFVRGLGRAIGVYLLFLLFTFFLFTLSEMGLSKQSLSRMTRSTIPGPRFSDPPADEEIYGASIFEEPLVPTRKGKEEAEDRALAKALRVRFPRFRGRGFVVEQRTYERKGCSQKV